MENQSLIILTQYMINFIQEIIENNQKFQLSEQDLVTAHEDKSVEMVK